MASFWSNISVAYQELLEQGDPRVKNWPLMSTPFNAIGAVLIYGLFVKVYGPRYMKNREPFNLKLPILAFNAGLMVTNFYVFYELGRLGWFSKYSYGCQPVDYSNNKDAIKVASTMWFMYCLRFVELFDTVFFVLRKKFKQVNALQIIHHASVPIFGWYPLYIAPGGYTSFSIWLNSFVHVIMYFYYFLSAMGPGMHKYLWWKRYLTIIQMSQLVVCVVYYTKLLFLKDCEYYTSIVVLIVHSGYFFLALFLNFYLNEYHGPKRELLVPTKDSEEPNKSISMEKKSMHLPSSLHKRNICSSDM